MPLTRAQHLLALISVATLGAFAFMTYRGMFSSNLSLRLLAAVGVAVGTLVVDRVGWKLVATADTAGERFTKPLAKSVVRIVTYLVIVAGLLTLLVLLSGVLERLL